jgi:branched-chain amino acid aminotransferase
MLHGTHNAVEDPRNEEILISINGEFFKRNEAKISVFDSGYLVGDGVWEGFRLKNGKLIFLKEHLNRLWQSGKAVHMKFPFSKKELEKSVWDILNANDMTDGVHIRLMVTRGIKKTPSQDPRLTISGPNVVIIPEYKKADESTRKNGITLFTSSVKRGSPDYLDPRLNCHSKLHEVQALIQAIEAGYDEALMLDINGFVSTCNATNFFMVKNGEVWTSTGEYCMNGITRANIIRVCKENNIPCVQKNFSLFEVYDADECFVTGSFGGVTPVTKIDGRMIENDQNTSMTNHLSNLYKELVEQEISNDQ